MSLLYNMVILSCVVCVHQCKQHHIITVLDVPEFSGDSPVSNDPSEPDLWLPRTPEEIEEILRQEEQEHREEEERLRRKDEEKKKRKKEKKHREAAERKAQKELKKAEEERWLREEAEAAEERRRRQEEQRKQEEERMRRMEMEQRLMLQAIEEAAGRAAETASERQTDLEEEDEEIVWLRGDVFEMPPLEPTAVALPPLPPLAEPVEPTDEEEEDEDTESEEAVIQRVTHSLPKGCTMSDVTVSCDNAKLTSIPPLSIPELKSLNLEGKYKVTTKLFSDNSNALFQSISAWDIFEPYIGNDKICKF